MQNETSILDQAERLAQLLRAAVDEGNLAPEAAAATAASFEVAAMAMKAMPQGSVANDLRPYPNFARLGITRAAGPATAEEIAPFVGQTRADGSPVGPEDFFSVGSVIADNELVEDRMIVIPAVELGRLKAILELRAKGSDEDHTFRARDGHFRLVAPALGTDPELIMHEHNPLLGIEPYTAVTARAIFPIVEEDEAQKAAVERARRGIFQDLSMTPMIGSYTCGCCGEMAITDVDRMGDQVVALKLAEAPEMDELLGYNLVLRLPDSSTPGGYRYKDVCIAGIGEDGVVAIEPTRLPMLDTGAVAMLKMNSFMLMFGLGGPRFCPLHGLQGGFAKDGQRIVARATNLCGLINVGQVAAGAINSARLVLDPSVRH